MLLGAASATSPACESLEDRILLTGPTFDIDADGYFTPLGDGIMAARFMNGLMGDDLVDGAVNPDGRRTDPDEIFAFLKSAEMQELLDLDGDGELHADTDGLLLVRGLANFSGTVLMQDATAPDASRTNPEHVAFLVDTAVTNDDTANAVEGMKLLVPAEEGLLQNDPVGASIVGFDKTSKLGAHVNIAAAGSYTYDPQTSDELNQLGPADSLVDSFTYKIEVNGRKQVVNVFVAVTGAASDGQDLLTTDDNTPIGFEFEKGEPFPEYNVLDNDSVAGLTVVEFDATSALGASVEIDADGTLRYNPTVSNKLNSLNGEDVLQDTFNYTSKNSLGQPQDPVTVTVDVSGANDSPIATFFIATATAGGPPLVLRPLDFVSDIDQGEVLTITDVGFSPDRSDVGTLTLNNDGSVTYDLSSADYLNASVPAGEVYRVRQAFYEVEDSSGQRDSQRFYLDVTGKRHAPKANFDDYTISNLIPKFTTGVETFIEASFAGLLGNDNDIDGDVVSMVSVGDFITQRGATVTINSDGSFLYDPTSSSELQALAAGAIVNDQFTYTINDSANDGETEGTAILEVEGHDFDRNPVVDLSGLADTSNGGAHVTASILPIQTNPPIVLLIVHDEVADSDIFHRQLSVGSVHNFDSLTIIGTPGNDTIRAESGFSLPLHLIGQDGHDDLLGGEAKDFLDGGPGNDALFGGGESDVFLGQSGNDTFDFEVNDRIVDLGEDDQVLTQLSGALNRTPTPTQLNVTGEMTVRLVDYGMFGNFVTITGPTGYGFQLDGNWSSTQHPDGSETFTGTSVSLKTAVGSIPLGAMSLNAAPDMGASIANRGPLASSNNGLFSALDLLTNNSIINEINAFTGIEFNSTQLANQGLTFGLKLGSELMANELSGFSAPLNNAIPYLFAQFNLGTNLVNFGGDDNLSVSSSNSVRLAFVFDPADPFFWLRGEVNGIGGSIGFSRQGNIPFRPTKTPDAVPSSKQIYGNVTGSIKVPVQQVFRVEGLLVLDYDRGYGPGSYSGSLDDEVNPNEFASLFKGNSSDLEVIVDALSNTELGVNGAITFTPDIGAGLGLSLPIASGTAMFFGGKTIAFNGGTDDPFEHIQVLQTLGLNPGTIESDGYFRIDTLDFRVEVEATQGNGKFGPFSTTGDLSFVIDNDGVSLDFGLDTPVASSRFSGHVAFQDTTETLGSYEFQYPAGTFELTATVSPLDVDFVVATAKASMTLSITNRELVGLDFESGAVTYRVGAVRVGLSMSFTLRSALLDVDLSADVDFSVASNGDVRFRGILKGTIAFGFGPVGAEFEISNDGIRLQIDWLGIDTNIPFPGFLHVSQLATGKQLADRDLLKAASLTAITDEAIRRLEASGLTNDEVAVLRSVTYRVEDRDNREQIVGYAAKPVVTLDRDAAGHGWFIDATPEDDSEFETKTRLADSDSQAFGRVDLLSVVTHELTHILDATWPEKDFDFGEVETEWIRTGQRFAVEPSGSSDRRQEA